MRAASPPRLIESKNEMIVIPITFYVGDSDARVYDALETIFSLSFIPLVPYPARSARHLPHAGNAVKLSKILIAHASNSVCFFHPLSLLVNNKIKKLVK